MKRKHKYLVQTVFVGIGVNGNPTARACASYGDRIDACVLSPTSLAPANNTIRLFGTALVAPLFVLANSSASVLLPADLVDAYRNPASIAAPLLLQCASDSGARQAVASLLDARGYDPELGLAIAAQTDQLAFPASYSDVNNAVLDAFSYVARNGAQPVNMTQLAAPVMVLASAEDANFGGGEADFFAALPAAVKNDSKLVTFAPSSGAAAPMQLGAGVAFDAAVYPWLEGVLGR